MGFPFEILKREFLLSGLGGGRIKIGSRGQMDSLARFEGEVESLSGMGAGSEEERWPDGLSEGQIQFALVLVIGVLELGQGAEEERGA